MVKWDNSINETAQNFAHAVGLILGMYKDEAPATTGRNKICGTEQDEAKSIMSSSKPKENKWLSLTPCVRGNKDPPTPGNIHTPWKFLGFWNFIQEVSGRFRKCHDDLEYIQIIRNRCFSL